MPKEPTGKRPVPPIAKGKGSNRWLMGSEQGGPRTGSKGTKPPTGNRPVPPIAKHTPPGVKKKNASKPAVPHTSMSTASSNANTGKDRAHGG